ncbi:MAG: hypothetical protein KAY24_04010, partial [Candidatus Eisenbacteria sp.]|nr:hypothetical protein [Candidatus Eisenbacteria bacterium]
GEVAGDRPASVTAARCRALIALERFDEAGQAAAQLEELAPASEETYACMGHLLWFQGRRAEAVEWVTRAIDANPNRVENVRLYLDPEFPRPEKDPIRTLDRLMKKYPQSWALESLAASLFMAKKDWDAGVVLAIDAAAHGAADELLVELTGRMGHRGLHKEVARLAERAGGWSKFLESDALLRSNLAASLQQVGQAEAARSLWSSVYADGSVHPQIRRRAAEALEQCEIHC